MSSFILPASLLLCAGAAALAALPLRRRRGRVPAGDGALGRERLVGRRNVRGGHGLYFAIVEFDRFAAMRTTLGYEIAGRLLETVGKRIETALDEVRLGRMGQSSIEFTFHAAEGEGVHKDLAACLASLEEKVEVSGIEFRLKGTVAFAPIASDGSIQDSLFDSVVTALSRESTERVRLAQDFARGLTSLADVDILRLLPRAMADNELTLHYQPKFDCRVGGVFAAEGLLRWNSPALGPVPVQQLITLAEQTGAIRDITLWTVEQASRDQAVLRAAGHELTLFVNLSGMLMADRRFMSELLRLIRQAPGKIGIEITETAVIDDPQAAIENIEAFSGAGIPVAIDDFGAGLSSLTYLKQLPADELKIDREFVMGLAASHRDPLIVRAAIDLAHAMEMKVTAEGVDDPMSLSLLRVMGCDMLQGYFISRPVPLPQLIGFLKNEVTYLSHTGTAPVWSARPSGIAAG